MSREQWGHGFHAGLRAAAGRPARPEIDLDFERDRAFDTGYQVGQEGFRWRLEHAGFLFVIAERIANWRVDRKNAQWKRDNPDAAF